VPRKYIDLSLDYEEIRKRIELDMAPFKKNEWADKIKVSNSLISNVHKKEGKEGKATNKCFASGIPETGLKDPAR